MSSVSEWQWVEDTECWQYWHEPSNLVLAVYQIDDDLWRWQVEEFWDTDADPLVLEHGEEDTAIAAQVAARAWLEADHD